MTSQAVIKPSRVAQTNARVELARYSVSAGERVIYGQRVLGVVRLVDESADGSDERPGAQPRRG